MTQARGPWIGAMVAVPIAFIGRSQRVLRTAIITVLCITIGGAALYVGLNRYTSGPTTSQEQETAQYRQQLLTNYIPIAKEGGAWGWGQDFPRVGGQGSIDNEYLFVALTQGWVGLLAFCLIALETMVRMFSSAVLAPEKSDRYFAWSMLGIFLGLLVTIFTVFLGLQTFQLFFLLAGWSQALPTRPKVVKQLTFESVYT
jgi:magnesium-transporting ATPase (P-type)